jgi:hypothetical protein
VKPVAAANKYNYHCPESYHSQVLRKKRRNLQRKKIWNIATWAEVALYVQPNGKYFCVTGGGNWYRK